MSQYRRWDPETDTLFVGLFICFKDRWVGTQRDLFTAIAAAMNELKAVNGGPGFTGGSCLAHFEHRFPDGLDPTWYEDLSNICVRGTWIREEDIFLVRAYVENYYSQE